MDWARGGKVTWPVYDVTAGLKEREAALKNRRSTTRAQDLFTCIGAQNLVCIRDANR